MSKVYVNSVVMFVVCYFVGCCVCTGQDNFANAICTVTTENTRSSGFVVAKEGRSVEVWTTSHGLGSGNSRIIVSFGVGTTWETSACATLVERDSDPDSDCAKLIVEVDQPSIAVLEVGSDSDLGGDCYTMGHPQGRSFVCGRLLVRGPCSLGSGYRADPAFVNGQSGSPVVKNTKVVGFVHGWRMNDRTKEKWGVVLPISRLKNLNRGRVDRDVDSVRPFVRRLKNARRS